MIKKALLTTGLAFAAFGTAHAQNSQYGPVENFYQANVDVDAAQYAGRAVNPSYFLVDWNQWNELEKRLSGAGYVRLGLSNWICTNLYGGGVPQKDLALAYARALGASIVMYAARQAQNEYNSSEHLVGFYAKQTDTPVRRAAPANRPTSAEASVAINRAQDAWQEPRVKGGVQYDPETDTYSWIYTKTGKRVTVSAAWFLDKFGAYL
jgi:hypothetical protein